MPIERVVKRKSRLHYDKRLAVMTDNEIALELAELTALVAIDGVELTELALADRLDVDNWNPGIVARCHVRRRRKALRQWPVEDIATDVEPHGYAREKFYQAVDCLVGEKPMRKRLGYALAALATLTPDDVPLALRDRFVAVKASLTGPLLRQFSYKPNEVMLRSPRSGRLAREIFSIYIDLSGGL